QTCALPISEAAKVIVGTLLQLQPQSFPSNILQANTIRGDQWFAPYVRVLNQNGGDLEDPSAFVELSQPITRAQFIYNLLILLDSKAEGIMVQSQRYFASSSSPALCSTLLFIAISAWSIFCIRWST